MTIAPPMTANITSLPRPPLSLIDTQKRMVRAFIRAGADHHGSKARFARQAELMVCRCGGRINLARALYFVANEYRRKRDADQLAAAFGFGSPRAVAILWEARLILRYLRRAGLEDEFPDILATLTERYPRLVSEAAE